MLQAQMLELIRMVIPVSKYPCVCRYDAQISSAFQDYSERRGRQGMWGCFSTIQLDVSRLLHVNGDMQTC